MEVTECCFNLPYTFFLLFKEVKKYLIDAPDTNKAEKNTFKLLEDTTFDWEIIGINLSKICEVYLDEEDE